jgi:ribonuclease VapC
MSTKYILDASALLALLQNEAGAKLVAEHLSASAISTVNLAETASVLNRLGMPENEIHKLFQELDIETLSYERNTAIATGGIKTATSKYGLSLGDRACLATAKEHQCVALTADKAWLSLDDKIAKIKLIC